MKKEFVYLSEMPKNLIIETKDMIIVGTGEKKEVIQHEGLFSKT